MLFRYRGTRVSYRALVIGPRQGAVITFTYVLATAKPQPTKVEALQLIAHATGARLAPRPLTADGFSERFEPRQNSAYCRTLYRPAHLVVVAAARAGRRCRGAPTCACRRTRAGKRGNDRAARILPWPMFAGPRPRCRGLIVGPHERHPPQHSLRPQRLQPAAIGQRVVVGEQSRRTCGRARPALRRSTSRGRRGSQVQVASAYASASARTRCPPHRCEHLDRRAAVLADDVADRCAVPDIMFSAAAINR